MFLNCCSAVLGPDEAVLPCICAELIFAAKSIKPRRKRAEWNMGWLGFVMRLSDRSWGTERARTAILLGFCHSGIRRREGDLIFNSLPFNDGVDEIRGYVPYGFALSVGPTNGYLVDFGRLAEAEVLPKVVLRYIARATLDLAELRNPTCLYRDASADREPIAFGA